jgi:hypothetical protein
MPEVKKENVEEVIQPADGNAGVNTHTETQESSSQERTNSEERNWKEVREIMHQQKNKIIELEEKLLSDEKKSSPSEDDPYANLSDDDIVTVGDTKKLIAKMAKDEATKIVEEREKKRQIDSVPSQYNDYNDVIKLVDEYVKENPAAEAAIMNSPNPRLTAYQMVKSSILYNNRQNNEDSAKKVLENSKKPVSSQTLGTTSPLSEVGKYEKMTPKKASEIRKLAEEYASRR